MSIKIKQFTQTQTIFIMRKFLCTMIASLAFASAQAGGFQVVLQGVRQTSMGNTGTGIVDINNAFFNPGSVAFLEKNEISVGANFIFSSIAHVPDNAPSKVYNSESPISTPFFLSAMFGVGAAGAEGTGKKLKVGLNVTTPFGSTVQWGNGWSGQYSLNKLKLTAIYVQPTVAYQITDKLGFGAGFDVILAGVELQRTADLSGSNGNATFNAPFKKPTEQAYSFNVGLFYKATDKFSIGLNYRHGATIKVKNGDVKITNVPALAGTRTELFSPGLYNPATKEVNAHFNAQLQIPHVGTIGFGYQANENLLLTLDARVTAWETYTQLGFEFRDPKTNAPQLVNGGANSYSPRNYKTVFNVGAGVEHSIKDFRLRAGMYYDQSPVQNGYMTAETPDANTIGTTVGIGYKLGGMSIDLGFLYINKMTRVNDPIKFNPADGSVLNSGLVTSNIVGPAGTYDTNAFIPSFALSYKF